MRDLNTYIDEGFFSTVGADADPDGLIACLTAHGSLHIQVNCSIYGRKTWVAKYDPVRKTLIVKDIHGAQILFDMVKDWSDCWGPMYEEVKRLGSKAISVKLSAETYFIDDKKVAKAMFWVYNMQTQTSDTMYVFDVSRNKPIFNKIVKK